jgi:hypothetical protein
MFAKNLSETMKEKEDHNLAIALGVDNENELIETCLRLAGSKETCSEILKALVCSDLNTKQLVYCAFVSGRMQEMNDESANNFVMKHITARLFEKFKNEMNESSNNQ